MGLTDPERAELHATYMEIAALKEKLENRKATR